MFRICSLWIGFLSVFLVHQSCGAQGDSMRYQAYRPAFSPSKTIEPTRPEISTGSRTQFEKVAYRLGPGDVVGMVVQGVIGDFSASNVRMPDGDDPAQLPAFGHPLVVLKDGTLPLPLITPVRVDGLTVTQARDEVARRYIEAKILKLPNQVWVSLMRKRTVTVNVLHRTSGPNLQRVSKVRLPGDQASTVAAVAESGTFDPDAIARLIPRRNHSGLSGSLRDGDTISLDSPAVGYFYSGGLLPGNQHRLRSNQPINALQAISIAGGFKGSRLGIVPRHVVIIRNGSSVRIPYSQVLQNPGAWTIQPGDHVWVQ
ncbi:polysaccharide biosynthesis/export family protein [Rubripirellula amarantea]|nr:polysaccharide biosynthesis/export family protein [Rubripirellula amarantea]